MADYQFSFEKLNTWKDARSFVSEVYQRTHDFPEIEKFGLTNQIRRASVSIAANIAEGTSRVSYKDQAHFSQLAYSSLMEVLSHLYIAYDLSYVSENIFDDIKTKIVELSRQINALRKSQLTRLKK